MKTENMKTVDVMLIAPVGTREVTLKDLALLPDETLAANWNHADVRQRTGARAKGEVLLADLDRYAGALTLEILGKAVRHVCQKHGHVDRLILVASDQPETTAELYRRNDTVALARVIRELWLRDPACKLVGDRARIEVVTDNPSNYDVMRGFYRERLPGWCRDLAPAGICYLAVTGGTAQMGTMLLFEGVRALRGRAAPLYVMPDYDMPLHLDVGRQMLLDELRDTLRRDLAVYAYHAAWQAATENAGLLAGALAHYRALVAVLDCGRRRLNFDFAGAQAALFGADRGLPPAWQMTVLALAHELSEQGRTPEWLIAEVYHSAVVRLKTEAYEAFVGRVFRFQEALLRYLCERWGAQFGGENRAFLDLAWLDTRPTLKAALGLEEKTGVDKDQAVLQKRGVTRWTLRTLALGLAREAGNAQGERWIERLSRFEQVAGLRNQVIHGFEGVSPVKLAKLYGGGAERIVADMAGLLAETLGVKPDASPYDRMNTFCVQLMEGS